MVGDSFGKEKEKIMAYAKKTYDEEDSSKESV